MKHFLLILVKLYWFFVSPEKRRHCIYSKSCSKHVYDTANENGLLAGLNAMFVRIKTCRPNHEVVYLEKENIVLLKLSNGTILQQDQISSYIVSPYMDTLDNRK